MLLAHYGLDIDRIDDKSTSITLNHHELINVLLLIHSPKLIKSYELFFQVVAVLNNIALLQILLTLKMSLEESCNSLL